MNKFVKYIVIITAILIFAFLGQQRYLEGFGKTLNSIVGSIIGPANINSAVAHMSKLSDKITSNVSSSFYSKLDEEVEKRGEIIKNEVSQEKQKISEGISEAIKDTGTKIGDYFSGILNSVIHPGTPQDCPPCPEVCQ